MKENEGGNGSVKSTEYSRACSSQASYLASEGGIFVPVVIRLVTSSTSFLKRFVYFYFMYAGALPICMSIIAHLCGAHRVNKRRLEPLEQHYR